MVTLLHIPVFVGAVRVCLAAGQTVMIFDGVDRSRLEPFGALATPTLSDLFVALMQRPTANPEVAR